MYRLLIVEDEEIIRKALTLIIDWQSIGFQIAATAENGVEALEILQTNDIDVVLTDIRMPLINGLELACELKTRYPRIKTILLSAYGEFDYAIKAIEYGVYGYLLKSSNQDEIRDFFTSLAKKLGNESFDKSSMSILRNELLKKLILNSVSHNLKEALLEAREHQLHLSNGGYLVSLVEFDNPLLVQDLLTENKMRYLQSAIRKILFESIENHRRGYICDLGKHLAILWTGVRGNLRNSMEEVFGNLTDEITLADENMEVSVTIAAGTIVEELSGIEQSYRCAMDALRNKLYSGGGRIIYYENHIPEAREPYSLGLEHIAETADRLAVGLSNADIQDVILCLGNLEEKLLSMEFADMKQVYTSIMKLLLILYDKLSALINMNEDSLNACISALQKYETIPSMFDYLRNFLLELPDTRDTDKGEIQEHTRKIIDKAVLFMKQNYSTDIRLEELADHVNVHPTYLSRLFSQQTGKSYKEYLTGIRMENAKHMLVDLSFKVYEISDAVGYKKPRYFSELFKKITGYTPLEYREKFAEID